MAKDQSNEKTETPEGEPESKLTPTGTEQAESETSTEVTAAATEAEDEEQHKPDAGDVKASEKDAAGGSPDAAVKAKHVGTKLARLKQLAASYWHKKLWTLPATILLLVAVLMAVPVTRYMLLGLAIKEQVHVTVLDASTGRPVSGVSIVVADQTAVTDVNGKVTKNARLGSTDIAANKQYYKTATVPATITFSKQHNTFTVRITATGRRVPVRIVNKITGQGVAGVKLTVLGTNAKTDKNGNADIVLPTTSKTQKLVISVDGFNTLNATVEVTDQTVAANTFKIVPTGKLYFLSNQSGKIDVVKTNLDGSEREIVLAGTGTEDPRQTSLLASRDWKYLALLAKRTNDVTSINIIDTTNKDKATSIDDNANSKSASFYLIGWTGDTFSYYVQRGYNQWQPKQYAIKAYKADTQKLNLVYETDATGDQNSYATENIGWVNQVGDKLVWFSSWMASSSYWNSNFSTLDGKTTQVYEYDIAKGTKRIVKNYDFSTTVPNNNFSTYYNPVSSYSAILFTPQTLYFSVNAYNSDQSEYDAYQDGKVSESAAAKDYYQNNSQQAKTFLLSPSGNQTFWSENRDGKNALFVGDTNANNGKQIGTPGEFDTYGWYSDGYLLVSKKQSEVYVMPVSGGDPIKITDYYKPAINYYGYGGGYGGN